MTFILLMAMHPEVQKRAQAEIDRVVGTGRLPTFEDRHHLLYVHAVLRELFRWHQLAPLGANPSSVFLLCCCQLRFGGNYFDILGVPHATTANDVYDGYFIPKGTIVIGNIW
jgi:cytochrome P450